MDRSYEGWFYASGTIALTFSFSFFIGLLSFMLYRIPTIQAALNDSDETPIELFEMPTALNQSMFVGNDRQAAETTPSMSAARSISDLFGETNTTSIQTLLNDEKRQNTAKLNLPSVKIDAINALKGADSRTDPKIQLNTFKAINSAQEGSSRASRAAKTLEESYYSEVYKRLYAAWTPGHSDLGKMAQIE
ncbi:MAG: hypothetical protein LBN32_03575, partial [Helicobacteraceae bacterium]|nr:hypothetical protein [Helicobacteraceae bacterium]